MGNIISSGNELLKFNSGEVIEVSEGMPIPMPTLWLAADSGIVKDAGGKVSQWQDQSQSNFNAIQPTSANQPLWLDNALNGFPVLRFELSSSNFMKVLFSETFSQPTTLFYVHKIRTSDINQFMIDRHDSFHYLVFKGNISSTGVAINAGSSIVSSLDVPYDYNLFSNVFNLGASELYINGLLEAIGNTGSNTVNGLTLGARFGNTNFANVDFAEILFYPTLLSELNRKSVENYLMAKYAL